MGVTLIDENVDCEEWTESSEKINLALCKKLPEAGYDEITLLDSLVYDAIDSEVVEVPRFQS